MVSTAHEQFKALRMWPEAVECLIVAERKVEAEDMVKDRKSCLSTSDGAPCNPIRKNKTKVGVLSFKNEVLLNMIVVGVSG